MKIHLLIIDRETGEIHYYPSLRGTLSEFAALAKQFERRNILPIYTHKGQVINLKEKEVRND